MTGRVAHLALADGTLFPGRAFGADASVTGEVVFTTGMTGYQEVLTDPSYCGQIVTMTSPHIGNTGINPEDPESVDARPQVAGFVVRDKSTVVSNWRSEESLDQYLARHGIAAITDIDTRKLTRHLRDRGAQNGAIGTDPPDVLVERARSAPSMEGLDLVERVTPKAAYDFTETRGAWNTPFGHSVQPPGSAFHVVALDFGAKRNILRCLVDAGCKVTAVPATDERARDPRTRTRTASSSRTAPATPPPSPTPRTPSASSSARSPSSASASATSCSRSRSARRPTS